MRSHGVKVPSEMQLSKMWNEMVWFLGASGIRLPSNPQEMQDFFMEVWGGKQRPSGFYVGNNGVDKIHPSGPDRFHEDGFVIFLSSPDRRHMPELSKECNNHLRDRCRL